MPNMLSSWNKVIIIILRTGQYTVDDPTGPTV